MNLTHTDHRPWPIPSRRWAIFMRWHDLLFAHWPVAVEQLRPLVPAALEIDTFQGQAWLGVVPFRMSAIRPAFLPPAPGLSAFPEINVRTYVTFAGKPGVWFFSLDATSRLAVRAARASFHLNYFDADISVASGASVDYCSVRTHPGAKSAEFQCQYRPVGEPRRLMPGTLEHWFIERYCLYAAQGHEKIWRCDIHHEPWPAQPATAEISWNTMARPLGIELPNAAPQLHFAKRLDTVAWMPQRIV